MPSLPTSNNAFYQYYKLKWLETTNHTYFSKYNIIAITLLSCMIGMITLLLPLSTPIASNTLNKSMYANFIAFYAIFTIPVDAIGFCSIFPFEWNNSTKLVWVIFILIGYSSSFIYGYNSNPSNAQLRGLPAVIASALSLIGCGILSFYQSPSSSEYVFNYKFQIRSSILLYFLNIIAYYTFQILAWKNDPNLSSIIWIFPLFWFVLHCSKYFAKRVGRLMDINKNNVFSAEVFIEVVFSCYYYIYYRNLFLELTSWTDFIVIKIIHILLELSSYSFRMSSVYYVYSKSISNILSWNCCVFGEKTGDRSIHDLLLINDIDNTKHSEHEIWNIRISIDYMIRLILSVTSGLMYIITMLFVEYGWNQQFYHLNTNVMRSIQFTSAALGIEICVYLIVIVLTYYIWRINILLVWNQLIHHNIQYFLVLSFVLVHVLTDVFVGKLAL